MNAVTKLEAKASEIKVQPNQGWVTGRLGSRSTITLKEGKRFLQLLMTPAPDLYSMPGVIEIKSIQPLGTEGDDWAGFVRIGGYPNNYEITDKDGVIKPVRSARVVLEAIEQ